MDFIILDERSRSHPTSTWTEYLCLVSIGDGRFRLDVRTRPIICEYHEWLSEQQAKTLRISIMTLNSQPQLMVRLSMELKMNLFWLMNCRSH